MQIFMQELFAIMLFFAKQGRLKSKAVARVYQFFLGAKMIDKTVQDQVYFHKTPKHQRLNNPTFASSLVNDSLTLFIPQKQEHKGPSKVSEYKRNFELVDKSNILPYKTPINYGRYSKDVFDTRPKPNFSQHGTNILSNNSQWTPPPPQK